MQAPCLQLVKNRKMYRSEPMFKLPKNALMIMSYIENQGPATQKTLYSELNLSLRALRYALRRMELRGVIFKKANLTDMRSLYYTLSDSITDVSAFVKEEGLAEA